MDLAARHRLMLSLDGKPSVTVNLRQGAANRREVTLEEMVSAINNTFGLAVAAHDGHRLTLTSAISGKESRLELLPLKRKISRRFVSRTPILDEASLPILGFIAGEAQGAAPTRARLTGSPDLSRGIDLRTNRFLRLAVDGGNPLDMDCAGPRPRATTPEEITSAINGAIGFQVASHDGRRLTLTSPISGTRSHLIILPSQALDARESLLGLPSGTFRGKAAVTVNFTGTRNLAAGVDLPAHAKLKIGFDGHEPLEVPLTGDAPAHKNLNQLMLTINIALGQNVARHDGRQLSLVSPISGAASGLVFAAPTGHDATFQVFGITPPRSYHGEDPQPAQLKGIKDLSGGADLRSQRLLRLGADTSAPRDIDCALGVADASSATLDEIVSAINHQLQAAVASHDGNHLMITSTVRGPSSRLVLGVATGGDAAAVLFGPGVTEARGSAPTSATLTGTVDLLSGIDLSQRSLLHLSVDGGRVHEIHVAGAAPGRTFSDEIVSAINHVLPGLASLTDDDRLQLTSPITGEESRVSLLPLRHLEVVEYPPVPREKSAHCRHGETIHLKNSGAAEVFGQVEFSAAQGVAGPGLADLAEDWCLVLLIHLKPGERARVWRDMAGKIMAERETRDGMRKPVPWEKILLRGHPQRALSIPQGRSQWLFVNCLDSRFNAAHFGRNNFTGGPCHMGGIFNFSRFFHSDDGPLKPVFAWPPNSDSGPSTHVMLHWQEHEPGVFHVNLPADLPPRFGGRFNEARFALPGAAPEFYPFSVTEPPEDAGFIATRLNASSRLVTAKVVPNVPLGWQAVPLPFRKPRSLTLGSDLQAARIYLAEEGFQGFLEVESKIPGPAGNSIRMAVRKSGPALFDVSIEFEGARFENARRIALGEPLPALTSQLLKPAAVGLLQAKAAGVQVTVTRDRH